MTNLIMANIALKLKHLGDYESYKNLCVKDNLQSYDYYNYYWLVGVITVASFQFPDLTIEEAITKHNEYVLSIPREIMADEQEKLVEQENKLTPSCCGGSSFTEAGGVVR